MTALAEQHKTTIEEATARLLARTENRRSLETRDLSGRVRAAVEKYLLRDNPSASAAEIRKFAEELHADDLCLIVACERGSEPAWNELVEKFDATVKSAARKISQNAEDAQDLAGSIWAELYGLKEGKSKLAYYSGRGSLAGWLRAVVSQLAIDQYRKQAKFVQIEESREFENLASESSEKTDNAQIVAHTDNPEEIFSDKQTARDVSVALREAIGQLGAEDRLILKLYYFDDLKLKEIGATLGFHEATASRKLVRIQTEIRRSVEKILKTAHGWSEEEVKRHLAETASKLGISFERLFTLFVVWALVQEALQAGVL